MASPCLHGWHVFPNDGRCMYDVSIAQHEDASGCRSTSSDVTSIIGIREPNERDRSIPVVCRTDVLSVIHPLQDSLCGFEIGSGRLGQFPAELRNGKCATESRGRMTIHETPNKFSIHSRIGQTFTTIYLLIKCLRHGRIDGVRVEQTVHFGKLLDVCMLGKLDGLTLAITSDLHTQE